MRPGPSSSPRVTGTGYALTDAARRRGLHVEVVRDWRKPVESRRAAGTSLYAGLLFADAVAGDVGLGLLEALADWLARLPYKLTGREVEPHSPRQGRCAVRRS
ncbi:hypothetical protein ABZT04_12600 [Streptomyces sp. NPDC005492]|uniref:hypothetical protein n=1 Tax=Streptomyces sp. NPDC005492 TaxID=3156883 RepID=UPI0033A03EC4